MSTIASSADTMPVIGDLPALERRERNLERELTRMSTALQSEISRASEPDKCTNQLINQLIVNFNEGFRNKNQVVCECINNILNIEGLEKTKIASYETKLDTLWENVDTLADQVNDAVLKAPAQAAPAVSSNDKINVLSSPSMFRMLLMHSQTT